MGRQQMYSDRMVIKRYQSRRVRGEVITDDEPTQVGAWIPCLYRTPSGKANQQDNRTYLPENAIIVCSATDSTGAEFQLKQGDELTLQLAQGGGLVQKSRPFRIVGEIIPTREKRRIVSYMMEVTMDSEY